MLINFFCFNKNYTFASYYIFNKFLENQNQYVSKDFGFFGDAKED